MRHRLLRLNPGNPQCLGFENNPEFTADAVILACGGGSWPRTGSDGRWLGIMECLGIHVNPLAAANCGWEHDWPDAVLLAAEGRPLKNLHVTAGGRTVVGELLVTRYGLEGGAIYQLGSELRVGKNPEIRIDFKPTFTHRELVDKMQSVRSGFVQEAARRWRLSAAVQAILTTQQYPDIETLARATKSFPVALTKPRPLDEAISSAGGVSWNEIDPQLMLKKAPGIFVAGEMIDWEAPTGGYLMQGCFATGTCAATSAIAWLGSAH